MKNRVYILSTGRAGTTFLFNILGLVLTSATNFTIPVQENSTK